MFVTVATLNICKSVSPAEVRYLLDSLEYFNGNIVVCLQEVDKNARRSDKIDVPKVVAGNRDYFFTQSIAFDGAHEVPTQVQAGAEDAWEYGLCTVTTLPINERIQVKLDTCEKAFWMMQERTGSCVWEYEPRVANIVCVECGKKDLWVVNTHLAHTDDRDASSPVRLIQIRNLNKALTRHIPKGAAVIVAGDFNATAKNPDLALLRDQFTLDSCGGPTYENKAKGTSVEIDHMFHRNLPLCMPPSRHPVAFSDHALVSLMCNL